MNILCNLDLTLAGFITLKVGEHIITITEVWTKRSLQNALDAASEIAKTLSKRLGDVEVILHRDYPDREQILEDLAESEESSKHGPLKGCYFKKAPQNPTAFALLAKDGSILAITDNYPLKGAMDKGHKLQKQHQNRPGGPNRKSSPGGPNPKSAPTSKSTK